MGKNDTEIKKLKGKRERLTSAQTKVNKTIGKVKNATNFKKSTAKPVPKSLITALKQPPIIKLSPPN